MSGESKVYDIPPAKQASLLEKAKRRLELRNYFLKQSSDPFKHATSEGGFVFDPAVQRYQSLKASEYERFKPNLKTVKFGFWIFVLPFTVTTYLLYRSRTANEAKLRAGEVAYKDRGFKFI